MPLATGSQTAGSVIRPGAFCGVAAFKPSYKLLPTIGMKCYAWSLDTVGLYGAGVADVAFAAAATDGAPGEPLPVPVRMRAEVRADLDGLPTAVAETLLVVAALAVPTVSLVEAIVGAAELGSKRHCYVITPSGTTEVRDIVVGQSNDTKAEIDANMTLLRRQSWIDVPVVYESGRRALFTMEKGIPGDKVFDEALKAWQTASAG